MIRRSSTRRYGRSVPGGGCQSDHVADRFALWPGRLPAAPRALSDARDAGRRLRLGDRQPRLGRLPGGVLHGLPGGGPHRPADQRRGRRDGRRLRRRQRDHVRVDRVQRILSGRDAASTTYICPGRDHAGPQTITISASDGSCVTSRSATVLCIALADGGGPATVGPPPGADAGVNCVHGDPTTCEGDPCNECTDAELRHAGNCRRTGDRSDRRVRHLRDRRRDGALPEAVRLHEGQRVRGEQRPDQVLVRLRRSVRVRNRDDASRRSVRQGVQRRGGKQRCNRDQRSIDRFEVSIGWGDQSGGVSIGLL